tara:strand:- start:8939 stop:9331 length:393 start_codon:yes stop_codon:yes gene_type:complete
MKEFKSELRKLYGDYEVSEVESKRREKQILAALAQVDLDKKPFYVQPRYLRVASVFIVVLAYMIYIETQKRIPEQSLQAKLESVVDGLEVADLPHTTLALGSPNDAIYENLRIQSQTISDQRLRQLMEDI